MQDDLGITAMDYVRGAIFNAVAEGMSIDDLVLVVFHAKTPEDFDNAVNTLAQTVPCTIAE